MGCVVPEIARTRKRRRGHPQPGVLQSRSCTSCAFLPISLRRFPSVAKAGHLFPPLRRGAGGVVLARSVTGASHGLFLSVLSQISRGDMNRSRPTRLTHHPPYPPFARGGKGIAGDVVSARATKTR